MRRVLVVIGLAVFLSHAYTAGESEAEVLREQLRVQQEVLDANVLGYPNTAKVAE